ncbi:hypothetical protein CTI12_AA492340 [Artemisia annua]|uniref:Replication protein A 70 kDa DNA-binding subunit B/D first OB fold domain-containing protein n=1 Tax=Artemisia annua TaxID=35608 RepID=A0A2U1LH18_ARTAN|nr:hypothetical protein CTI12_AA492340 [Artemisia annua]
MSMSRGVTRCDLSANASREVISDDSLSNDVLDGDRNVFTGMVAACDTGVPANIGSNTCYFPHSSVPVTAGLQSSFCASQTSLQASQQVARPTGPNLLSSNFGHPIPAIPVDESVATSMPVRVTAVDGLVSIFRVSNIVSSISGTAQHSSGYQGASTSNTQFRIEEGSFVAPTVLDFLAAVSSHANASSAQIPTAARRRGRTRMTHASATRQPTCAVKQALLNYDAYEQVMVLIVMYSFQLDIPFLIVLYTNRATAYDGYGQLTSPGPIAPPQREGAPTDYKYFGRCDQTLQEDVIQGLIQFLDDNNALVQLFRTARDKLREADIPNFQIRLFGVVGANQYELPTADTIGAIVYEGGPESMTDYDVVIERHSREPESVNKLHPTYMALQFPLLFVYGEEGYHLNLTLRNSDPSDSHEEKKMTMKIYYAYQLCDRVDLNPTDNTKFIEARVYRKWTAMKVPSLIATGFSYILLDKKGSVIQANADLKEKERFEHDLQANCVYRIEGFRFEKTDSWGKTLDNDFTLCFGKHTRVDLLKDDELPYHYFNFAAYNELDYIGYVHNVEKVKEYGSAAGQIQLSATSATCYYFNPPIEEASELLAAFNQNNAQVLQLEVQTERLTDWEQERARNRVPLATLLQIDPNTQQRVLFTQEAMILQVDTAYDWYYQKCDECGGKLEYGFIHGHCHPYGTESRPENRIVITDGTGNAVMTCFSPQTDGLIKNVDTLLQEVTNKDPAIIPPQILALQNTRHVFQFRFAKPMGKGPPTFVLQKVMDRPPSILPAPTEGPSSPPTTHPGSQTASQTSPPPATPKTTQETPADTSGTISLPTTSTVRKELFKSSTDEEGDPEPKKQKTE